MNAEGQRAAGRRLNEKSRAACPVYNHESVELADRMGDPPERILVLLMKVCGW